MWSKTDFILLHGVGNVVRLLVAPNKGRGLYFDRNATIDDNKKYIVLKFFVIRSFTGIVSSGIFFDWYNFQIKLLPPGKVICAMRACS